MKGATAAVSPELASALAQARACLQQGRTAQAEPLCRDILAAHPDLPDALFMMGLIDLRTGRAAAALERLAAAAGAEPGNLDYQSALAAALSALERHGEAAEVYAGLLDRAPQAVELRARYAVALQQSGRVTSAIEHYRRALDARPKDPFLHYSLGTAHKRLHAFEAAIDAYERAASLAPGDVRIGYALAVALMERGRMGEAALAFERVVSLDPRLAPAWGYLAFTRIRASNGAGAVEAARTHAGLPDAGPDAESLLSNALLAAGDAPGALEICDRILAREPAHVQALADRSIALVASRRREEARALIGFDHLVQVSEIASPDGFEDIDAFNSALIAHLRRHPDLRFDFNSISCHNGQTSGEILIEPKGPVHLLEAIIERAGQAYLERLRGTSHPWIDAAPGALQLSAWCTVLRSRGYQHGHIHPSAWLSGVYYLRLPAARAEASSGGSDDRDRSGWLELGRSPSHYPDGDQGEIRTVAPAPGTLVLFPSFVYHRTIPFDSDDERITIAFDFRAPGEYAN